MVHDSEAWKRAELVDIAAQKALFGLSKMVGVEIKIRAVNLKRVSAAEVSDLVGGPEKEVVAIHLAMNGPATGHVMLLYSREVAY